MAQQTAVEWLTKELWSLRLQLRGGEISIQGFGKQEIKLLEEAKQIEEEQIMKTAIVCHFEGVRQSAKTSEDYIAYGKQYYNETYGGKKP